MSRRIVSSGSLSSVATSVAPSGSAVDERRRGQRHPLPRRQPREGLPRVERRVAHGQPARSRLAELPRATVQASTSPCAS